MGESSCLGLLVGPFVSKVERLMNVIRLSLLTAIVAWGLFAPEALAIVGGEEDTENIYSNVGAVVFAPPGEVPNPRFTGTLIHPRVFLTCAHAVLQFRAEPSGAIHRLLRQLCSRRALSRQVARERDSNAHRHPDYHPNGYNPHRNDVGVIILKTPIDTVPVQELPEAGFLDVLRAAGLLREPGQGECLLSSQVMAQLSIGLRRRHSATARWFAQTEYLALTEGWLHTAQTLATGKHGAQERPRRCTDVLGQARTKPTVALHVGGGWRSTAAPPPPVDIAETLDFVDAVIGEQGPARARAVWRAEWSDGSVATRRAKRWVRNLDRNMGAEEGWSLTMGHGFLVVPLFEGGKCHEC